MLGQNVYIFKLIFIQLRCLLGFDIFGTSRVKFLLPLLSGFLTFDKLISQLCILFPKKWHFTNKSIHLKFDMAHFLYEIIGWKLPRSPSAWVIQFDSLIRRLFTSVFRYHYINPRPPTTYSDCFDAPTAYNLLRILTYLPIPVNVSLATLFQLPAVLTFANIEIFYTLSIYKLFSLSKFS